MTNTAEAKKLIDSFFSFYEQANQFIDIKTKVDYECALDLVEHLLAISEDTADNPILHLVNLIAASIEKYENNFEEV
ncbi:MAG: hypothetical protein GQ530_07800, partial [Desulfuromonadales bacterium]|nr:hypothetical protein [Desulfuromonadales bacterium]